MMGETVARTLCQSPTKYQPGHWFNSAKFFDIEYQTYGWVWAQPKTNEKRFVWQHPTKNLLMHFNFDNETHQFIGINTFGIRLRHEIFDRWLTENRNIEYVLKHLKDANFDPEFYKAYESEILAKFNTENNTQLKPAKKSWKRIFKTA